MCPSQHKSVTAASLHTVTLFSQQCQWVSYKRNTSLPHTLDLVDNKSKIKTGSEIEVAFFALSLTFQENISMLCMEEFSRCIHYYEPTNSI